MAFNDIAQLEAAIDGETAAVFIEPVQGEGGVRPANPEFLRAARELTRKHGALLIFDEIQSGFCRTGKWWGHQHAYAAACTSGNNGLGGIIQTPILPLPTSAHQHVAATVVAAGIQHCTVLQQHFTGFALGEAFVKVYELGGSIKVTSTLAHPNTYGAYLVLVIFPLIMLSIYEKNKNKKILYILLSTLVFVNLLMTFSRNALLGFILGIVLLALIYSIKLMFALGGFGILTLFIPSVFHRVMDITSVAQNESRIKLWKTALMMIKEHPILGVGNGNFVTQYDTYIVKYRLDYNSYTQYPAHNSYLKIQSELGLIGIISFLGIIITALFRVKAVYSSTKNDFHRAFYMGVMASMVAFLFMNLSDNLFFVPKATTYFWFLLATAEALLNNSPRRIFR